MDQRTDNWTFEEFHAFTMLYAANADGMITEEEEMLTRPNLSDEAYSRIKTIFMSCDDIGALNVILSYRDQFLATPEQKDRILTDMQEIYQADSHFDQIERGVHQLFKRIL